MEENQNNQNVQGNANNINFDDFAYHRQPQNNPVNNMNMQPNNMNMQPNNMNMQPNNMNMQPNNMNMQYNNMNNAARPVEKNEEPSDRTMKALKWWNLAIGWARYIPALVMIFIMCNVFSKIDLTGAVGGSTAYAYSYGYQMGYSITTQSLYGNPLYLISYGLCLMLAVAALVLGIVDIVMMGKKKKPLVGLILFFLLLRPGYIIWREHLMGEKLTWGIINIVIFVLYFAISFTALMIAIFSMMGTML